MARISCFPDRSFANPWHVAWVGHTTANRMPSSNSNPVINNIIQQNVQNTIVVNQLTQVFQTTNVQASATAVVQVVQQPGNVVNLAQGFSNGATGGQATATATAFASATVYLAQSGTAQQTTSVASATVLGIYSLYASGQTELAVSVASAYSTAVASAFGCGSSVAQLINAYISIILTLLNAQSSGTVIIIG
ncbi:hypothetical protein F751_2442 [Auxenochlorella protothecoides]|uniref:Uncharacterized protein n=1 Tax=Auxenochlorella protothecoides TaxID=3075 RepID=A0A087SIP6_AUXPR|nr:hypothetical protein F751_2442 [Auxenochlorella protothecoides]KFM25600.1 hypothetical protein F751_2442 [Auxenochlorella protothecoides]